MAIGAPRLRQLGVEVPEPPFRSPEHRLDERLREHDPDGAHSRYNALLRRLVSFERAARCEQLEPQLYRFPALDPGSFRRALEDALADR